MNADERRLVGFFSGRAELLSRVSFAYMETENKPGWLVSSSDVPAEQPPKARVSEFVADVYRMYGQNFWEFYKITVPPTLLALFVYTVRPLLLSAIGSGLPRGREILMHPAAIVGMAVANFGAFFLVWFFEAFSFAAVSDVVGALQTGVSIPEGDGYGRARERIWEVLKISFSTYALFIFGFAVLTALFVSASIKLGSRLLGNFWFSVSVASLEMFLVFAAMIGFALAIPIVMATDASAGKALRLSWRLTDGHEGKLILFVAESLLGAVIAMYAMSWLSYLVFSHVIGGEWGPWLVAIATALVGASVQAPMLVAFALLYFKVAEPQPQ